MNTKLECLGGRYRTPVDALGILSRTRRTVSDRFSDIIYSFQSSLHSVVFSLTTAPLTDDSFSVSSSCHTHKDPYFWRWLMETYTPEIFSTCWITGLDAALDLTVIFPDESSW